MAARTGPYSACTICKHPARPQIDLALAAGVGTNAVADRFKCSRYAVSRHRQSHLTSEMRTALATKLLRREGDVRKILLEEGEGVVEALKAVRGPLFGMFLGAIDAGDSKAAAALSGRLHVSAKVTGELMPHAGVTVTNVLLSPDFQRLRSELLRVLVEFPEAHRAVSAVFRRASDRAAAEMGSIPNRPMKVIEAQPDAA
jgi:hypothetical protein